MSSARSSSDGGVFNDWNGWMEGLTEHRESSDRVGSDLDSFIGVWSEEDEAELRRAIEPFEQIDPGLWK